MQSQTQVGTVQILFVKFKPETESLHGCCGESRGMTRCELILELGSTNEPQRHAFPLSPSSPETLP